MLHYIELSKVFIPLTNNSDDSIKHKQKNTVKIISNLTKSLKLSRTRSKRS